MNGAEFLDNRALLAYTLVESLFEFIKFSVLFVEVLDESSAAFLHLMESTLQSFDYACHGSLDFSLVLRMPDIMSDKFLDSCSPLSLEVLFVAHNFHLVHEAIDILNEDIITSDKHLLLLARFISDRLLGVIV